jgi:hypothetical protein
MGIAILAILMCVLFAIFTVVMFFDQVKLIIEDSSTID